VPERVAANISVIGCVWKFADAHAIEDNPDYPLKSGASLLHRGVSFLFHVRRDIESIERAGLLFILDGFIISGFGDASDDCVASVVAGSGIGEENGDRQAAPIGQGDQADVVRSESHAVPGP
jgi:hypothetical protein